MKPAPTPVLDAQDSVEQALRRVQDLPGTFLVRMSPSGWSVITSETLKRLVGEGKGEMSLGSTLPIRNLPYLHPDLTLEAALRHVYQVPLVPVVHRADFRRLEGVISREDVLEKYKAERRMRIDLLGALCSQRESRKTKNLAAKFASPRQPGLTKELVLHTICVKYTHGNQPGSG